MRFNDTTDRTQVSTEDQEPTQVRYPIPWYHG